MIAFRKYLCALFLALSIAPAFADPPPPVPALPDVERRTSYSISGTTCICSVGFALYADGTDVDAAIEVWINGVRYLSTDASHGWALSSATGSLGTIPRPITNAVLTFTATQTGTVQIVGARRPRRTSQFNENRGVAARDLNQVITDLTAQNRETWDKLNDVTGRALVGIPGNTYGQLPAPSSCIGAFLGFDGTGLNPICLGINPGTGNVVGPSPTVVGHIATWGNTNGTLLADLPVTSLFANPTQSIDLTTHNGSAVTAMRSDAAPALSQSISPAMTGNWAFNPTSTTLPVISLNSSPTSSAAQGFKIQQAGSFTTSSTVAYNSILAQTNAVVNSPGVSARGLDVGIQAGASAKGSIVGVNAEADQLVASVTTGGDIVGVVGTAFATQPNGGTDPVSDAHGTLFGSSLIGIAGNGATAYQIVTGSELQAIIQTGGTAQIRFAASIAGNGSVRGSTYDAGIGFYNYSSGGGFLNAILLTNILTNPPLATSGCLICTDGSSDTIATGIDLSAYTISGNFLKGPGGAFQVTGAGAVKGTGYTVGSTAGASCTLTTVSHLTVVNGIVTLCN